MAKHIAIMTWILLDLFIIFYLQFIVSAISDLASAMLVNLEQATIKDMDNAIRMKTQAEEEPDWWTR
jgi:hypothetical protein